MKEPAALRHTLLGNNVWQNCSDLCDWPRFVIDKLPSVTMYHFVFCHFALNYNCEVSQRRVTAVRHMLLLNQWHLRKKTLNLNLNRNFSTWPAGLVCQSIKHICYFTFPFIEMTLVVKSLLIDSKETLIVVNTMDAANLVTSGSDPEPKPPRNRRVFPEYPGLNLNTVNPSLTMYKSKINWTSH